MEKKDFSTERQNFLGGIVVGNRIEPIKHQEGQDAKQPMVQSEQQYKQQLEKMQKEEVSSIISKKKYTLETNRKVNEYIAFGTFIALSSFISMFVPFGTILIILLKIFTLGLYKA